MEVGVAKNAEFGVKVLESLTASVSLLILLNTVRCGDKGDTMGELMRLEGVGE